MAKLKKDQILKWIGIGAVAILLINLLLFALQIIKGLLFWVIIILAAVFAYKLLPRLKK